MKLKRIISTPSVLLLAYHLCGCNSGSGGSPEPEVPEVVDLLPWTEGYIDSPFMVPDGTTIYFLHSPVVMLDLLNDPSTAAQEVDNLPGHQGVGTDLWWNTDLYVSTKNPDGTWTFPENLGPAINTSNLECCVWVDDTQTTMIFTREGDLDAFTDGRNYISTRADAASPWSDPVELPGEIGSYGTTGYHDLHMTPTGTLIGWSELSPTTDGAMFESIQTGENSWAQPIQMPAVLQDPALIDSQPWLSADERTIYYNRRDPATGETQLMTSIFDGSEWEAPLSVSLQNFVDANGAQVWGEPSFNVADEMLFVRFDTSVTGWKAELMTAPKLIGNAIGTPTALRFEAR
ncbi:MAG: hypothetical protein ABW092_02965 [Candidatus Thiodiazotropha sp.]